MTFFYDKPLKVNTSMGLQHTSSSVQNAGGMEYAMFRYGNPIKDSFGKKAMPLEVSSDKIQELAMNNPRIMQIINENKLWEY